MNSISQGIQTAHVIGRMSKFYRHSDTRAAGLFWQWLEEDNHNETIIVLNGGMGANVVEAYNEHSGRLHDNGIPSGIFYEETRAFGTHEPSPTCWACVLPEEIYDAKRYADTLGNQYFAHSSNNRTEYKWDHSLYNFLEYKNSCGLAK